MDQATPLAMDRKKLQHTNKLFIPDKETQRRNTPGAKKQQGHGRSLPLDNDGGGSRKGGRGAWGRSANKQGKSREKDSAGQVGSVYDGSLEEGPEYEEYDVKGKKAMSRSWQSWYKGSTQSGGGGAVRRRHSSNSYSKRSNALRTWQSSCQFLMNGSKEALALASEKLPVGCSDSVLAMSQSSVDDPDTRIVWGAVEEVVMHMTQETSCPICLYPPAAAQVTRCGHVYCYPCILHYLALSDNKGRACPICFDNIQADHLRSVRVEVHPDYKVGDTITMRLMKRNRYSMVPVCVPTKEAMFGNLKKSSASIGQMNQIVDREQTSLEVRMAEDKDQPEACFIQFALTHIESKRTRIAAEFNDLQLEESSVADSLSTSPTNSNSSDCFSLNSLSIEVDQLTDNKPDIPAGPIIQPSSSKDVLDFTLEAEESKVVAKKGNNSPKSVFYFYQAEDGSHVYLYSVNMSMMVAQYGSIENCPPYLTATIVEKEYYIMTDSQRHKAKHLCHLPLHCPYETVEVKLGSPLISKEVLTQYQDVLSKRQRHRKARMQEERKIERRNQVQQEKELNECRFKRTYSAFSQKPDISPPTDQVLLDYHFPTMNEAPSPTPAPQTSQPPSFAKMLQGPTQQQSWPGLGPCPSNNSRKSDFGAWGKPKIPPASTACPEESEESHAVRSYSETFLEGADVVASPREFNAPKGKKKKGRKSTVVLFKSGI